LTFLGRNFLRELYRNIILDQSGISIIYEIDRIVQGFVMGTTDAGGFYSRLLKKHWWRFGKAAFLATLRQPRIIPRLIRAFQKPKEYSGEGQQAVLMSIAVLPLLQGKGIGRAMVEEFLRQAKKIGLNRVSLTTDKNNNQYVNDFYRQMGFRIKCSFFTPEKREMIEYVKDI
jgi:ribosomal protein S18 acetylase RimI-like enzyme